MRRAAAIVGSLLMAPAGPIILGHFDRVAASFFVDLTGLALYVAGALLFLPSLVVVGVLLFLLVRLAMIATAIRRPPAAHPPGVGVAVLAVLALFAIDEAVIQTVKGRLVEAFKIPAGSMIPTLQVGDHIYVDKRKTEPKRGDVIVFDFPREPDKQFCKRVIAVGGDTVEWKDGQLFLNGRPVERTPISDACRYWDFDEMSRHWEEQRCRAFEEKLDGRSWRVIQNPDDSLRSHGPVVVAPGHYYVLGDNRDNSHDSRFWGTVPPELVKGTALYVWWSSGPEGLRSERFGQAVK